MSFATFNLARKHALRGVAYMSHRKNSPYTPHQEQRSYDNGYKIGLSEKRKMNTTYSSQGFTIDVKPLMDYVHHGRGLGHFLTAVLENDFKRAVFHADSDNLKNLPAYAWFLANRMPHDSHGSPAKVTAWLARWAEGGDMHGKRFDWNFEL